jgi:hypothetical protein
VGNIHAIGLFVTQDIQADDVNWFHIKIKKKIYGLKLEMAIMANRHLNAVMILQQAKVLQELQNTVSKILWYGN